MQSIQNRPTDVIYQGIWSILYKTHGTLTRIYTDLYTRHLNLKYGAPIDPYKLYIISPDEITHKVQSQFWYQPVSTVKGGDWDKRVTRFDEHYFYISLKRHFNEEVPWKETELYKKKLQELNSGKIYERRYGSSEDEIIQRLEKLDDLYDEIQAKGYKTQKELRQCDELPIGTPREQLPPELFEIAVNIGRNGEWLFDDGRHRLTIAKLLNIDKVPVRVLVRHKEWQEQRDRVVTGRYKNQPDSEHPCHDHEDLKILNSTES